MYIDDLDRCSDGKSVQILEAVQLLFNETAPNNSSGGLFAEFGGWRVFRAKIACSWLRIKTWMDGRFCSSTCHGTTSSAHNSDQCEQRSAAPSDVEEAYANQYANAAHAVSVAATTTNSARCLSNAVLLPTFKSPPPPPAAFISLYRSRVWTSHFALLSQFSTQGFHPHAK